MNLGKRRLRNFLLRPLIQIRLGFYTILLSGLFSFCIFFTLYVNLSDFAEILKALTDQESQVRSLFSEYLDNSRIWFVIFILGFWVLNFLLAIVYTHRLVGPIVAFRHHVQKLMAGDLTSRVKLRKDDAFHDFADDLNHLAIYLENRTDRS